MLIGNTLDQEEDIDEAGDTGIIDYSNRTCKDGKMNLLLKFFAL